MFYEAWLFTHYLFSMFGVGIIIFYFAFYKRGKNSLDNGKFEYTRSSVSYYQNGQSFFVNGTSFQKVFMFVCLACLGYLSQQATSDEMQANIFSNQKIST